MSGATSPSDFFADAPSENAAPISVPDTTDMAATWPDGNPRFFKSGDNYYRTSGPGTNEIHSADAAAFLSGDAPPWAGQTVPGVTLQQAKDGEDSSGIAPADFFAPAPTETKGDGKVSGTAANIGAGASDAIAGALGAPVDILTGAVNFGSRAIQQATGYSLGEINDPVGGSNSIKSAMGLVGADPRKVVPKDEGEKLARSVSEGATSAVLPWGVARAFPVAAGIPGAIQSAMGGGAAATQAVAGGTGALTGDLAADAVPDAYKPFAKMAGNLAGGATTLGAISLGDAVATTGVDLAGRAVAPLTQGGREGLAAAKLRANTTDVPAAIDALSGDTALVPGSMPTTYQVTGDPLLGSLERETAKNNPDRFTNRYAEQNAARVDQIQTLSPQGASLDAITDGSAGQAAAIGDLGTATVDGARANAAAQTSALGNPVPVGADQQQSMLQAFGDAIRGRAAVPARDGNAATPAMGVLSKALDTTVANEKRLWNAVDPDGTLAVNMAPVRDAALAVKAGMAKNAKPIDGELGAILRTAENVPTVQSFTELKALRSRLTTAMRDEMVSHGKSADHAMMSKLLDGVHQAIEHRVAVKAAEDSAAVSAGKMNAEDAIDARVEQELRNTAAQQQQETSAFGVGGGAGVAPTSGIGSTSSSGNSGAGGQTQRGFGNAARGSRISDNIPSQWDIITFLSARGGVKTNQDMSMFGAIKLRPGFLRNNGMGLDKATEAAIEMGYLPAGSTSTDLIDAVQATLRGGVHRVFRFGQGHIAQSNEAHSSDMHYQRSRDKVLMAEEASGQRLTIDEVEHATGLVNHGLHPDEAIQQAARSSEIGAQDFESVRSGTSADGMPRNSRQSEMPVDGEPTVANFDNEAAARYQAARAATAEKHSTFSNAEGVGDVLAPDTTAGSFKMPLSQVPSAIFKVGRGAAERMQAYFKAAGNTEESRAALEDYAAFDLRRTAELPDGTLDPKKYMKWLDSHSEAMSMLPELKAKIASAGKASEFLEQVTATAAAANREFEKSALGQFLGDRDPVSVVAGMLRSDKRVALIAKLVDQLKDNPAALMGLRRAIVEHINSKLTGNAIAGQTGTKILESSKLQDFFKDNYAALSKIFPPDDIAKMKALAEDLQRTNKSISGTKLPGGSNTAQDTAHGDHGDSSVLTQVVIAEAVGEGAEHVAGSIGKIIAPVTLVLNAMRQLGMKKVDAIVTEAMLNPNLARSLLMRPRDASSAKMVGHVLGRQLQALVTRAAFNRYNTPAPKHGYDRSVATSRNAPSVSDFVRP